MPSAVVLRQAARGGDLDGVIVHLFDLLHRTVIQVDFRAGLGIFNGSHHIIGCHFAAVVELDALLQMKHPPGLAFVLIAFHQLRLGVEIHIGGKQGAVCQKVHIGTSCGIVGIGAEGRCFAHGGDDDAVFASSRCGYGLTAFGLGCLGRLFLTGCYNTDQGRNNQYQAQHPLFRLVHGNHLIISKYFFAFPLPPRALWKGFGGACFVL